MPKTKRLSEHERAVMAAEQRVARLRAETDRAERELAALTGGEGMPTPRTERVAFVFGEPVLSLNLSVTPTQLEMISTILRTNGIHGNLRRRRDDARGQA